MDVSALAASWRTATRQWRWSRTATCLGTALVLLAVVAVLVGRRELLDLPAEDPARSIRRFLLGPADVEVNPQMPWARVPAWLPGRADEWAGGSAHMIVVRAGLPAPRALRLYVQMGSGRPETLPESSPPSDDSRAHLRVLVNGISIATFDAPTGGRPLPREGHPAPRLVKVAIPASALGGETSARVALVNDGGPGVALRRIRLLEDALSLSLDRLSLSGRFPVVSAMLLAAGLGCLLLGRLLRPGRDGGRSWRWALAPGLGLLLLALAMAAPAPTRGFPRGAWLLLILSLLAVRRGRAGPPAVSRPPATRLARAVESGLLLISALAISIVAGELTLRAVFRSEPWARHTLGLPRAGPPPTDRLNSLGFDEREFPPDKPPGVYRIALLGDSLSVSVGRAERFGTIIAERLNSQVPRFVTYEVLNFGRSGVDTIHQTEILRQSVWSANPDFVLLQWYVNDVENGSHADRPDHYALIHGKSGPARWLRRVIDRTLFGWMLQQHFNAVQENLGLVETYPEYIYRLFGDPASRHWEGAAYELRAFIDECQAHRVPLAVALFPHLSSGLPTGRYEFSEVHDQVLELCRRNAVPCVDLRSTFASHREYVRLWVHRFDPHPNALAHWLAAQRLVEVLGPLWLEAAAPGTLPEAPPGSVASGARQPSESGRSRRR